MRLERISKLISAFFRAFFSPHSSVWILITALTITFVCLISLITYHDASRLKFLLVVPAMAAVPFLLQRLTPSVRIKSNGGWHILVELCMFLSILVLQFLHFTNNEYPLYPFYPFRLPLFMIMILGFLLQLRAIIIVIGIIRGKRNRPL